MSATAIPIFNFAEAEQVARVVGFNPKTPGLAQDCLLDTQKIWWLPGELSDDSRFQAHFYIALGLFIWLRYGECDEPEPEEIRDWYQINTAVTSGDALFISAAA